MPLGQKKRTMRMSGGDIVSVITFNKTDKVEIFIDRENIEKISGHGSVDYEALTQCLAQGRPVSTVTLFDMLKEDDPIQKRVYDKLKELKIRIVNPKGHGREGKQLGVDVALATKVVSRASSSQCDTFIIVSGDGDFIPIIEEVKARGKKIEIASWEVCINKSLMNECDYFIPLDDIPALFTEEI